MTGEYDDIIDLPHHVSSVRRQMTMEARAAQFAPFAALPGHYKAIRETVRTNILQFETRDSGLLSGQEIEDSDYGY